MKSLGVNVRHCLHYPLRASITLTFHCKVATAKCCADSKMGSLYLYPRRFLIYLTSVVKFLVLQNILFPNGVLVFDHLCHHPLNFEHEK